MVDTGIWAIGHWIFGKRRGYRSGKPAKKTGQETDLGQAASKGLPKSLARIQLIEGALMILVLGAFLGFFSVAFGAYAEHGLRPVITEEHFRYLMTAIRYNQVNAAVTIAIGLTLLTGVGPAHPRALRWSGGLFILGTMLFSFSIYLSVILDIRALTYLTPFGGVTLMAAWAALGLAGISMMKNRST